MQNTLEFSISGQKVDIPKLTQILTADEMNRLPIKVKLLRPLGSSPKGATFTVYPNIQKSEDIDVMLQHIYDVISTNSCKSVKAFPCHDRMNVSDRQKLLSFNNEAELFDKKNLTPLLPHDTPIRDWTSRIKAVRDFFLVCDNYKKTQVMKIVSDQPSWVRSSYNWVKQNTPSMQSIVSGGTRRLEGLTPNN